MAYLAGRELHGQRMAVSATMDEATASASVPTMVGDRKKMARMWVSIMATVARPAASELWEFEENAIGASRHGGDAARRVFEDAFR
jgi:hypothetical protein